MSLADAFEDEDVHVAVAKGQRAETERILRESGEFALERRNAAGKTPLILAVEHQRGEVLELLLAHGANVSKKDTAGDTALHIAARSNRVDALARLLGVNEELCLE